MHRVALPAERLDATAAGALAEGLAHLVGAERGGRDGVELDLSAVDECEGAGVAVLVSAIQGLVRAGVRVEVHGAPQVVVHGLYKAALLGRGVEARGTRQDEPHAG